MRKRFGYLFYVVYIIVLLIAADFLVGLFYDKVTSKHAPYGRKNIEIFLGNENIDKAIREKPHPYMLWVNTPDYINDQGIKETNNIGYRNNEDIDFTKSEDKLRILALGGSTTWGHFLFNPEDTWPCQLQAILNRESVKNNYKIVEVINGGLNYATSAELLLHYLFRDRYLKPDFVIIHTGGNDTGPLIYHDYKPDYSDFRPGWNYDNHTLRKGERFLIKHSNIIKMIYAFWLRDNIALPYINKHDKSKSVHREEDYYIENAKNNAPVGFERNLELLLRNIIADGAQPILFPFIHSTDEIFNNLSPESFKRAAYTKNLRKGTLIALGKNIEVMKKLSKKYQVPLFELPADSIPSAYFIDHCHLFKEGDSIKATFLAKHIRPILN